jgi:PAS domain S-box-containing protein
MTSDSNNSVKISIKNTFDSILSDKQLRDFLQTAPMAIYEVDYNGPRFRSVNDTMCKLSGYSREELLLTNPFDLLTPESRELFKERIKKASSGERIEDTVEFQVIVRDGRQIDVVLNVKPIFKRKRCVGAIAIGYDITERKRTEEALRASEELYRAVFDNSTDGFMLLRPLFDDSGNPVDFRFLEVNRAYERQTGAQLTDVLGRRAKEVVPEIDPNIIMLSGQVVKTGKSSHYQCFDLYSNRWYDSYYFPFSKSTVGIFFRDVTEVKKTEINLSRTETKFDELVNGLPEMVLEIDFQGKVIFANSKVMEITGYSKEELENEFDANRLVTPEDIQRSKENMKKMFKDGKRQSSEYVFRKKNGTTFPVLLNSVPIFEGKEIVGIRGIIVDITERKNLERQVQENERLAVIGVTAGMVGHDIRNPLQAIMSDTYLLKEYLQAMPELPTKKEVAESLDGLESNISYIDKIVADLQDFAKPLKPEPVNFYLYELVTSVFLPFRLPDNLTPIIDIESSLTVNSDPTIIRRVLTNLITNAIQAMPNGGKLGINGFMKDSKIHISVSDTGIGISEEIKDKLFAPMFTTKSKGQGFGLAVAKRGIEALGGTITFESQVGKGTKFIIDLPIKTEHKFKA